LTERAARRPRDPAGRRHMIIDAAARVIAQTGLTGLTHRSVAEVANVPVGSTTYYFKDLDELREAALAHAAHASTDGLKQWEQALTSGADLPATLARLTAEYLTDHEQFRALNELYTAASHRPELRPLARLWFVGLVDILEPHIGRGAAQSVAVFIDGALLHALIADQPLSTDVLTAGLAKLMTDRPNSTSSAP
jgi:TetR/AcrR family transcriptional regulator, regulator of biofilm formation and stress response